MSALSDETNLDLTRDVERDGDVRQEPWFRELEAAAARRATDAEGETS